MEKLQRQWPRDTHQWIAEATTLEKCSLYASQGSYTCLDTWLGVFLPVGWFPITYIEVDPALQAMGYCLLTFYILATEVGVSI